MKRTLSVVVSISLLAVLVAGCANRVSFIDRGKEVQDYRWRIEKLKYSKLSRDQRALLSEKGKPDYIKFYQPLRKKKGGILARLFIAMGGGLKSIFINSLRPLNSYRKIEAWVYDKEGTVIWFKEGKRVDYVAVEE